MPAGCLAGVPSHSPGGVCSKSAAPGGGARNRGGPEVERDEPIERVAVTGQRGHRRAERPAGDEERRRAQVAPPEVAVSVAGEVGIVELAGGDGGHDRGGAAERATGSEREVERDVE